LTLKVAIFMANSVADERSRVPGVEHRDAEPAAVAR
jgi:hypothetical protein